VLSCDEKWPAGDIAPLHAELKQLFVEQRVDFEEAEDREAFKAVLARYSSVKRYGHEEELQAVFPDPAALSDLLAQQDEAKKEDEPAAELPSATLSEQESEGPPSEPPKVTEASKTIKKAKAKKKGSSRSKKVTKEELSLPTRRSSRNVAKAEQDCCEAPKENQEMSSKEPLPSADSDPQI